MTGLPALSLGVEERSDEAASERAGTPPVRPDPEVVAKPKRRRFTAEYRLRILEEVERCRAPGEGGSAASPGRLVQLSSGGLAQGAA